MFSKVLIANRGAIATRIIRTLTKLNVKSVVVYAESDRNSLHVEYADESYSLGGGPAIDTYLNIDKIIAIAKKSGVQAIHPGYGFLSENPDFVRRCEAENIVFIGPTAEQIEVFGLKHKARELALNANVPLSPGSELLIDLAEAKLIAEKIGFPLMLKSTAGGGGIGMQLCHSQEELDEAFDSVKRLGASNFSNDGVFIEKFIARARHIEVQIFADGYGKALAIGERDCSSQRRNQKVVEECPAPNLPKNLQSKLHETAELLLSNVNYRNAGTVEFIVDADTNEFYFLEVNTRLQVEHGVTEAVYNIDLVEWMLILAATQTNDKYSKYKKGTRQNPTINLDHLRQSLNASGHAIQVRIYAEDPYRNFQPCAGLLSDVSFPKGDGLRIDHWIKTGIEIPPYFDPMLAKVIVHDKNRDSALNTLEHTLKNTILYGIETNLNYLQALIKDTELKQGLVTTRYLNAFNFTPRRIDILQGGTQTSIQDFPARTGYWNVGVPPSGPFDSLSFRLANKILGNQNNAAGLEIAVQGPHLQFSVDTIFILSGAEIHAEINHKPVPMWQTVKIHAGDILKLGRITNEGVRSYLCIQDGIDCPQYLGSRSTFTLGQFGGHNGRALRTGDVLQLKKNQTNKPVQTIQNTGYSNVNLPLPLQPKISNNWNIRVIYGPHGAPDFFTKKDIETFFEYAWEVHYNSSRTGIRLIGPKPEWARANGGEAGLHPSNIHDNAYAFGTVDFTGDMPVILGPDGPSLGGFVCPATVITADLWKLGQLKSGDKIRFYRVSLEQANESEALQNAFIEQLTHQKNEDSPPLKSNILIQDWINEQQKTPSQEKLISPILLHLHKENYGEDIIYRAAGDHFLLIEYGKLELDITLRFRAHALMQYIEANPISGVKELTPGIRSLQIHYDSQIINHNDLLTYLTKAEQSLSQKIDELSVPSRIVHIPLSWDDEACQLAIDKYQQSIRKDSPWCPSNLEFIRRINGLDSIDDVKEIVFSASYLVMGLGDVYLGAPVATPIDPRHRLVTTKYNPARTWTAENSVGIGGSYMCVYGMEGPGGYQFVGRTLQMWNRYIKTQEFEQPWLLRFFDQIHFYEVSHNELEKIRSDFPQGRYSIKIEESTFNLNNYQEMLNANQKSISEFSTQRQIAFDTELAHWHTSGQFNYESKEEIQEITQEQWPKHSLVIDSPVSGSVWQTQVTIGQSVCAGDILMILESMKMEIPIHASNNGIVTHVLKNDGQGIQAGQALVVIDPNNTIESQQTIESKQTIESE